MRCDECHKVLINGIGKCLIPMWQNGIPAGFCDKEAYGITTEEGRQQYKGYVPYLACPDHGGPKKKILDEIV